MNRSSQYKIQRSKPKPTPLDPKDTFQFVLDTRNFEITNFWQRSNYFLVLNSGLAIGFFNQKTFEYAPLLAALGVIVSVLWYRVTIGSKFWQIHWENQLAKLETSFAKKNVIDADLKLFCQKTSEVKVEVKAYLGREERTWVAKRLDKEILKKPSVTLSMITLSLLFVVAWAVLFLFTLLNR